MHHLLEAAIIGAGPLGIELAIALKLAGISYVQFDKGQVGQMIANFPPQTRFFSSSERISLSGIPIQTLDQQKCSREGIPCLSKDGCGGVSTIYSSL